MTVSTLHLKHINCSDKWQAEQVSGRAARLFSKSPPTAITKQISRQLDKMFSFVWEYDQWHKSLEVVGRLGVRQWQGDPTHYIKQYASIWTPNLKDTKWQKLQISQNGAMRAITGCHLMASQDVLFQEAKFFSVEDHNLLLSEQYFLSCQQEQNPRKSITIY